LICTRTLKSDDAETLEELLNKVRVQRTEREGKQEIAKDVKRAE